MLVTLISGGIAAGFLAGMLGIGGGAIIIPVLIAMYKHSGMPATEAIRLAFGTSLATMAFTGLSSFLSHRQRGNVDANWLKKLFFPAGLGAVVGAVLAARIPGVWLAGGVSVMLAYFGFRLLLEREQSPSESPVLIRFSYLAGLFSGAAYSLAGMGGATMITFYLTNVGLPLRKAIGTATGVILPTSIGAMIGFGITAGWPHDWRWGYIDLYALLVMSICSVAASRGGVWAASALPTRQMRKVFGVFMMLLAVKTVLTVCEG